MGCHVYAVTPGTTYHLGHGSYGTWSGVLHHRDHLEFEDYYGFPEPDDMDKVKAAYYVLRKHHSGDVKFCTDDEWKLLPDGSLEWIESPYYEPPDRRIGRGNRTINLVEGRYRGVVRRWIWWWRLTRRWRLEFK